MRQTTTVDVFITATETMCCDMLAIGYVNRHSATVIGAWHIRHGVHASLGRPSAKFAAVARDIDRLLHGAQQRGGRMRVVPRCQRT